MHVAQELDVWMVGLEDAQNVLVQLGYEMVGNINAGRFEPEPAGPDPSEELQEDNGRRKR